MDLSIENGGFLPAAANVIVYLAGTFEETEQLGAILMFLKIVVPPKHPF